MSRVLVAEDDPEMLAPGGRGPSQGRSRGDRSATDGGRMLVRLAELFDSDPTMSSVDVIVTDMRMPVCSGLDLLERLAEARWKVPCILMTAFGDDETRGRAHRIGAALFDKPVRMDTLRAAVSGLARH